MPANGTSNMLQLTIALMDYGEISPYLFKFVKTGSQIEIRGPFGKHFVRESNKSTPLLLIGAGTGVVPLRAMRLEHQYENSKVPIRLLYSVKSHFDMAYKYKLLPREGDPPMDVEITFTRQSPDDWKGNKGRINTGLINKTLETYADIPMAYICGPTPFVESVAGLLIEAGQPAEMIKTERFGATAN